MNESFPVGKLWKLLGKLDCLILVIIYMIGSRVYESTIADTFLETSLMKFIYICALATMFLGIVYNIQWYGLQALHNVHRRACYITNGEIKFSIPSHVCNCIILSAMMLLAAMSDICCCFLFIAALAWSVYVFMLFWFGVLFFLYLVLAVKRFILVMKSRLLSLSGFGRYIFIVVRNR